MTFRHLARATLVLLAVLALAACASVGNPGSWPGGNSTAARVAGPQGIEDAAAGRRQLWLVPSTVPGLTMHAYLFRPPGDGPFRLAVVNHGSEQDAAVRKHMGMPSFPALTTWLLAHGYAVVLPQRPGHGETGGPYLEDQGSCDNPDYVHSGEATAASIAAIVGYFSHQPFVEPGDIAVIGNSAGGWGALALAAQNPAGVTRIVNFSGGRGGHNLNQKLQNCAPDRLVAAAGSFGSSNKIATLWLYAANDTYFSPALSRQMYEAFTAAGGKGKYDLLPAAGDEGHELMSLPAPAEWEGPLASFLGS